MSVEKTKAQSLKMGWRFEFINKLGGKRCGELELTCQQKIDIYAGINLSPDKKNCIVNGEIIPESGVANYIINVDVLDQELNYYLSIMQPIENFAIEQKIHFVCKALNYRVNDKKWDRNRSLAVYVNWSLDRANKLQRELVFAKPLSIRDNEIGANIKQILATLDINKNNFQELKNHLHKDVRQI